MNQENLIKFAEATNRELYDPDFLGGVWLVESVETHETIEQFIDSSNSWKEHGEVTLGEVAGLKFAYWPGVQIASGNRRRDVSVVDFGEIRVVMNDDITSFV